jgi:hypothetical protein
MPQEERRRNGGDEHLHPADDSRELGGVSGVFMESETRRLDQFVQGAGSGISRLLVERQRQRDLSTLDRGQLKQECMVVARVCLPDRPHAARVVGVSSQPLEVGPDLALRRVKLDAKGRIDLAAADRLLFKRLTVTCRCFEHHEVDLYTEPANRVVACDVTEHPASDSQRYDSDDRCTDHARRKHAPQSTHRAE